MQQLGVAGGVKPPLAPSNQNLTAADIKAQSNLNSKQAVGGNTISITAPASQNQNYNLQLQQQNQQRRRQQQLEWLKTGPITEANFFSKVKVALRTSACYENFLKCLVLFNQELINKTELIGLVDPFLAKFPNLYRWFKDYVEDSNYANNHVSYPLSNHLSIDSDATSAKSKFGNSNKQSLQHNGYSAGGITLPNDPQHNNNIHLEIDYLSCKQYGASYRDISAYPQPISSGQTELCKQVLNSTYVSFPSWSEDSTFISSKKNQYEELMFRTEDERFELDLVIESNMSTIRTLENLLQRLSQMSADEVAKYKVTNSLGGTSECIYARSLQKVYLDKYKDFIEAIKSNPLVVIPTVLKRLKSKDEEWREVKKSLERIWREQCERNYPKSLDYCAAPFKQNDQKHLKAKSLVTEIENIYYERLEVKEAAEQQSTEVPIIQHTDPHLSYKYEDKSIIEDAAALIIHHVKRQTQVQKEDKQKIKQIMYHFIPDLFFISRGALSDDESDPPQAAPQTANDASSSTSSNGEGDENAAGKKLRSNTTASNGAKSSSNGKNSSSSGVSTPTRHTDMNKRRLTDVDAEHLQRFKDNIPAEYRTAVSFLKLEKKLDSNTMSPQTLTI